MAAPPRAHAAEAAEVDRLLASCPAAALANAFSVDAEGLWDAALRALRSADGGSFNAARKDLLVTLAWRRTLDVDTVRARGASALEGHSARARH